MLRVGKVATPETAVAVVVPASTAPLVPVPAVIVRVTVPVKPVAVCPKASRSVTGTAALMAAPAAVDAELGKGGHARDRRRRRRSRKHSPARARPGGDRQGHSAGEARRRLPQGFALCDWYRGADGCPRRG